MPPENLNEILIHAIPKRLEEKFYLQRWDFKGKTYKKTCEIFERTEVTEQVYKGVTHYKITTNRVDANHSIHDSKLKGEEFDSSTNPEKGLVGKRKKNYAGHLSDWPTSDKICVLHGPRQSIEECKLLK